MGADVPVRAAQRRSGKADAFLEQHEAQTCLDAGTQALETEAEAFLSALVDPSKQNAIPNLSWVVGLTLIADPRLDEDSETAWYLAA